MASLLKVDKLDPQSGTALELGTSGDTISLPSGATLDISASTLTPPATMPASSAANLTSIPAANLTGTIAAISGANLTSLTATNLSSGTVPTARLGSGTASSSTVLYGDQTYKTEPTGGKVLQVIGSSNSYPDSTSSTSYVDVTSASATAWEVALTPSATTSKILVICHFNEHGYVNGASEARGTYRLNAKDGAGAYAELYLGSEILGGYSYDGGGQWIGDTHAVTWLHSPSSTNAITFKLTVLTLAGVQAWNNSPGYSHMTLMEIGA